MTRKMLLLAALATSLLLGEAALAQGERNNRNNDNRPGQSNNLPDRLDNPGHEGFRPPYVGRSNNVVRPEQRSDRDNSNDRNDRNNRYRSYDRYDRYDRDGRGAGPDHNYYRGERMPQQYRGNQYVVNDWRGHGLSSPPRGYHWVQSGSDYVLVAIATGLILNMLLNN